MASFSADEDLDKVWSRTLEQCQDIAKWDLTKTGATTVNEVIDKIKPKTKDPEMKDKAKAVLAKTLTCLQRFGSVIAQGASVVFGPSAQVMNGISFVIDLAQKYSEVFGGFVTIMERVSAFLGRMKVYLDGKIPAGSVVLDKRLRGDVYEVLHHFILVLAHSHKLASSQRAKWKLSAGLLLFGDDQGVKNSLANLEVKIANVSRMEITVILQEVSEAARDVRRVEEKIDRMGDGVSRIEANLQADQDHRVGKEQSEQITKRLNEVLQPGDPGSWTKTHGSFQSQIVEGTGSWLLGKHVAFQRWMDPKDVPPSVFVLSGGEGYGKSCLSSAVIHHLLDKYPKGRSDHHIAVAYYFFQRDAKEKSSVKQAIRDVLYQLTQYDTTYGKKMASALGDPHDLNKALDLWKVFVEDSTTKVNNTFFIVLDGVDEPDSDAERPLVTIVESLMSMKPEQGQLQVRLFLTGRPSELRKLEERAASSIPEVSLGSRPGSNDSPINEDDIVRYIDSRLKNMEIFQMSANEEVSALQNRIPHELAAGVKGDFVRLGYKLDEISRCTRVRQISEILERASETREVAIKRQVSTLNGSLTKDEIEDLNEILQWILGAMEVEAIGWVDTECLEGVLLLKTGTPAVLSLAKQIKSKYTSLLDLNKLGKLEFVTLVSDDIRQYLVTSARESQQIQAPNNEVQAAEVAIVKRVVSTFCGDDLYQRFNFEAFFDSMGGEKAAKIHIDEKSMHFKILCACLVVLCDKPKDDDDLKSLREYARMYFVEHLMHVDRDALDNDTVKWITTRLARILVEERPIDAWWDEEYYEQLRADWINNEEDSGEESEEEDENSNESGSDDSKTDAGKNNDERYVDAIAKWLRGSAIDGIEPRDRTWLQETLSGDNASVQILSRVLRRLAERWFGAIPAFETFLCVHGLYTQIHGEGKPSETSPSLDDINNILVWAKEELTAIEGEAHWNFRTAVAMKNCGHFHAAIECCGKCLDEEPNHWRARLCMGEALAGSGQTSAACECYQKLDELSEEPRESDEGIEELYWLVVLPGLANCYRELDNLDPAAEIYTRVLEHFYSEIEEDVSDEPDDGQYDYYDDFDEVEGDFRMAASASTNLMLVWYKQKKLAAIRALLESSDRKDTGYSGTRLIGVVQLNAGNGNFHEQLRALVNDADAFSFVDQIYISAIEATRPKDLGITLALQHYRAMLNWLSGALVGSQDQAFEIWTNIIETTIPDDAHETYFQTRIKASRELPKALLQRAKALGPGSPEANSYIERLESVANRISSVIYDPNEDPVLTLGRYYHLAGDETRAKSVLRKRMKSAFQDWDEGANGFTQHLALAHTFTALDDDLNALAAWSQLAPYSRTSIEPAVASGDDGLAPNGKDESEASDEDNQASSGAEISDESETDDSKSDRSDASASNNDPQTTEDTPEKLDSKSPVNFDEQSSEVQGSLTWTCDGCGSDTHVDNIYCCKDCLDIQFDSNCYPKLKAGLLDKSICDPNHEFLHIPPVSKEKWVRLTTKDAVEIGGEEISRKEWLAGIRADWGVDRETLEQEAQVVSSVVRIERVWKAFKARKNKRVQQGNGGTTTA